jgi:hypothetical protein
VEDLTARLMEEALQWGASRTEDSGQISARVLKEEGARLLATHGRPAVDDALWALRHATDLTDGRAKVHAIAALEAASAGQPEDPTDLA